MTPFTVRGVPHKLRRDAWWMAADAQSGVGTSQLMHRPTKPILSIFAAVILADVMLWQASAGLGFVILVLAIAAAVHWVQPLRETRRITIACVILLAAVIPAIDVVQTLSVALSLLGLCTFTLIMIDGAYPKIARAMLRLPIVSIVLDARDTTSLFKSRPAMPSGGQILRDWFLPLTLGAVFIILAALANPIVEKWFDELLSLNTIDLPIGRIVFWIIAAFVIWPILRLHKASNQLFLQQRTKAARAGALINPRSVVRALVMFNLIFAVQTVLDLTYLIGGADLPDGMTYAAYAHRGAYPLLATALLAGIFAMIAQPMLGQGRLIRSLLLIWVAQTVLLVLSSILRLDLYVGVYGLTVLRVAAFVWMGVVAAGLCLLLWQITTRKTVGWLLVRASLLGLATLYVASLTNISGVVARHNLARDLTTLDTYYLCNMGDGALPAIVSHNQTALIKVCRGRGVSIAAPNDLREWGYRNQRLRSNIATLQENAQ